MLNWPLLSQPANWLIVFFVTVIGIAFITFIHQIMTGDGTGDSQ